MKTNGMTKRMAYIGAGAGVVLFAIAGLLPGSFLGGVLGLNIAGSIYGLPLASALMPRIIVGLSMLLGVLVSGVVFISISTTAGWLIGYVIDSLKTGRVIPVGAKH